MFRARVRVVVRVMGCFRVMVRVGVRVSGFDEAVSFDNKTVNTKSRDCALASELVKSCKSTGMINVK